jgi:NAD(P)-dependent dehydrogenase (short-subunit alcohol dehydrogenase family)
VSKTILISGASSGFGALAARALADAGHAVYAGLRNTTGRNAAAAAEVAQYPTKHSVELRPVELDVKSDESVRQGVQTAFDQRGRLDVLIHNAGRLASGPAEAFTPNQMADLLDTNVLGAQRLNRAALPHLRDQEGGLLLRVGSSSSRGGTPPYLAPYFAAKAAADALATSYALEVARFGIETTIIIPGPFARGTSLFAKSAAPDDTAVAANYETRYPQLLNDVGKKLAALSPAWADVAEVAHAIVDVVDTPKGQRPFRVHVDPVDDGAVVVNRPADLIRKEFLQRIGLDDMLYPATRSDSTQA